MRDHLMLHYYDYILAQPKTSKDWHRNNIFHTYTKYNGHNYKFVIDLGNSLNIVS